jgi:UrcA family protein
MTRFTPLALAAAMLASSLSIFAASSASAEQVVRVSYRDLDLATVDGQAMLAKRLRHAADTLCFAHEARELAPLTACRSDVMAGIARPIQLAMAQDAVRLAGVGSATAQALR